MALALCLGLPWAPVAQAERADRTRPIHVEADSVKVDDAAGLAVYQGSVVLTQGTLMITADRIEVRQDAAGGVTGHATGRPVYFRQRLENSTEFTEGWASRLEYDGPGNKLHLLGKARLKRGMDEFHGEQITYHSATAFIQARGEAAAAGRPSGRVRAVIRPRGQPEAPDAAPAQPTPPARP